MGMGKTLGFFGVLAALPLLIAACGQPPPPEVPVANVPPAPNGLAADPEPEAPGPAAPVTKRHRPKSAPSTGPGSDKENPVMRCGPRDSYIYVADYQCKGGSRPLGSDPRAGGRARSGNVGPNSKGHIIDRYVVPCPDGDVEVFVDMYGCPEYEKMLLSPPIPPPVPSP